MVAAPIRTNIRMAGLAKSPALLTKVRPKSSGPPFISSGGSLPTSLASLALATTKPMVASNRPMTGTNSTLQNKAMRLRDRR